MVLVSPFMPHKQPQHHPEPGISKEQHAIARQRCAAGVLQHLGQGTPTHGAKGCRTAITP